MPPDSFKCSPLRNTATQDVFQSIVKGRKSWKTLRGGEVVWPPELEAALVEGLENYQPDDSRETRLLGRFPMRNRFISDWIFEKTGKRRTAKQVGSRLQQLRDTCGGKRLLKLLSPVRPHIKATSLSPKFHPNNEDQVKYGAPSLLYDSESSSDSSISSPTTPTEAHATLQSLLYRGVEPRAEEIPRTIMYIDLWTDQSSPPIDGEVTWTSSDEALEEEQSWIERGHKVERSSQQPRVLREIDPTVTLMSQTAISAQSHFTVHTDDGIVFSETTTLQPVDLSDAPTTNSFLYKTSLVPGFWETILNKPDASKYIIIQRVMSDASSSSPSTPIFSAMYKFNYATQQQPSSEPSTSHAEPQLIQSAPTANVTMPVPMIAEPRTDYDFDDIDFQLDAQSHNDMFSLSKNSPMFDLGSFMPFNDSVYPRPVHYTGQMGYAPLENANVIQHMLTPTTMPAFPPTDLSIYGL